MLIVAFVIIIIHNGLPQGNLPLCLNVKLKCLCSVHRETTSPHPPVDVSRKKKKLTHPLMRLAIPQGYLQNLRPFDFTYSSPPPLCAIKEAGIQTPIRWFIRDTSLASSPSAGFLNKVVFLASTPRPRFIAASRASLESVTSQSKGSTTTQPPESNPRSLVFPQPHVTSNTRS